MSSSTRRSFVRAAAGAAAVIEAAAAETTSKPPMRLGVTIGVGKDAGSAIRKVHDFGLPTCQVSVESFGPEMVAALRTALERNNVEATSLIAGGPGPEIYDFYQGPLTIGLVPRKYRAARIARVKECSDFAKKCGIPAVQTHCGFIREDPNDPMYKEAVEAIREVAQYCRGNGQNFRCETGQETPVTLVRCIKDVGIDNVGVNFDVANLILYGKANPVDAVDILGPYIQGVHAKDGLYPTDTKKLGEEVPIGKGKVNFPALIPRLKAVGYRGPLTIEREISGPKQAEDIRASITFLKQLIAA